VTTTTADNVTSAEEGARDDAAHADSDNQAPANDLGFGGDFEDEPEQAAGHPDEPPRSMQQASSSVSTTTTTIPCPSDSDNADKPVTVPQTCRKRRQRAQSQADSTAPLKRSKPDKNNAKGADQIEPTARASQKRKRSSRSDRDDEESRRHKESNEQGAAKQPQKKRQRAS
jgi:hypothetical protein